MLCCAVWTVAKVGDYVRYRHATSTAALALPAPRLLAPDAASDPARIRFFEAKVRRDPEGADAQARLAAAYLQVLRETGSLQYLQLASHAAHASLASVPAIRNANGLSVVALAAFGSHEFATARDDALALTRLDPAKSYPFEILGDTLLELGDYDGAETAYARATSRSGGPTANTETRAGRVAVLRGENADATRHFTLAIVAAMNAQQPPRETIAWSYWQLGETAFAGGDYATAETDERDALVVYPGYYRALASLARVRAARGDANGAIALYQDAIRRLPDPTFVAALGDLYAAAGRQADAAAQYDLVETIGHLSAFNGVLYNRQLALYYADHDLHPAVAYQNAKREYGVRRDIYGSDAVAWTALKAGRIAEARTEIVRAMRLGTRDARLFYHAGLIYRAAHDTERARTYLRRALDLNPQFDPLQSVKARAALASL